MTCATWSARLALVVLGCSVAATLAPATAGADNRIVDCAGGRRLAAALRLPSGRQLTVTVRGTCNESVTITRDDVTLRDESPAAGSGVNGTIVIDGARRVVVENLTISGPGIGIQGIHGAAFMVRAPSSRTPSAPVSPSRGPVRRSTRTPCSAPAGRA